ncbi:MAG: hypothetical protein LBH87_01405 [Coriobacteriales bacterium]|jgi:hypothetical protein|nr:hypothetical protein [Coriobacteriales bacterium]
MTAELSPVVFQRILKMQRNELTHSIIYKDIAKRQKYEANGSTLLQFSHCENCHCNIWKTYTDRDAKPRRSVILLARALSLIAGFTFTLKYLEKRETVSLKDLQIIEKEIPKA